MQHVTTSTVPELETVRRAVDSFLLEHCRRQQARAHVMAPAYGRLWHSITGVVEAGGKRLRPYMVVLAYQACGGRQPLQELIPIAAAWELLHIGLLVHDDIIDRDDTRHGQPNISGRYLQHYEGLTDADGRRHAAASAALLGGDLLLSDAYQLVLTSQLEAHQKLTVCNRLGEALYDVAGGELLDSESAFEPLTAVDPELIAEHKTASYSFIGPLLSGAELAGSDAAALAAWRQYGRALGIGYQLADDLLGVFGDSQRTGKSVDSDLQEAKRTAVLIQGIGLMTPAARQQAETLLTKPLPLHSEDVAHLRELLVESGVERHLQARLNAHHSAALLAIDDLKLVPQYAEALGRLADRALRREA